MPIAGRDDLLPCMRRDHGTTFKVFDFPDGAYGRQRARLPTA